MQAIGVDASEAIIDRDRLLAASECFLTNAVIGIWPVSSIDHKQLEIGMITRRLMNDVVTDLGIIPE